MEKNYSTYHEPNNMASDIIVGLDIGTTKVATIIGYLNNRGKIEILGHGKSASKGVEFGLIQNLLKAQESIKTSLQVASSHAQMDEIQSVYAGIAARHIRTLNCKHYILRSDHNALIRQEELDEMDESGDYSEIQTNSDDYCDNHEFKEADYPDWMDGDD